MAPRAGLEPATSRLTVPRGSRHRDAPRAIPAGLRRATGRPASEGSYVVNRGALERSVNESWASPVSPGSAPARDSDRILGRRRCRNSGIRSGLPSTEHVSPSVDAHFAPLPSSAHPSRARQGRTRPPAYRAPRGGQDRGGSRSRRPAPPLPPPGRVVPSRSARDRNHERATSALMPPTCLRPSDLCRTVRRSNLRSSTPLPHQPSLGWSPSGDSAGPPNESDEVMAKANLRRQRCSRIIVAVMLLPRPAGSTYDLGPGGSGHAHDRIAIAVDLRDAHVRLAGGRGGLHSLPLR